MNNDGFKTGTVVVMEFAEDYLDEPEHYPRRGTIGKVLKAPQDGTILVNWEHGSTSQNDCWWIAINSVRKVDLRGGIFGGKG